MHAPERLTHILTELSRNASVSTKDLTNTLGVTRETIRKDLELLDKQGKLKQVRGGAVRVRDFEPPISDRLQTNPQGKAKIARLVAERIPEGASIIIDSGSTTFVTAELLAQTRNDLSIYTNDIRIAQLFADMAAKVSVIGGQLDPRDGAIYGLDAIDFLRKYRADFALIGVAGLDERSLFTDFSREVAALRETMIASAEQSFVLADANKFGKSGRSPIALTGMVSLVSDAKPAASIARKLAEVGVSVLT